MLDLETGGDVVYRHQPWFRRKKILVITVFVLLFVAAFVFLLWDHFKYQDVTPPLAVQVWRDIAAVFVMLCVIGFSWQMAVVLQAPLPEVRKEWVFCLLVYIAAAIVWSICHFYYSYGDHRHEMPQVLFIIQTLCLIYAGLITLFLFLYIMAHVPPEAWILCTLCFSLME
jgi:hypothetical protein